MSKLFEFPLGTKVHKQMPSWNKRTRRGGILFVANFGVQDVVGLVDLQLVLHRLKTIRKGFLKGCRSEGRILNFSEFQQLHADRFDLVTTNREVYIAIPNRNPVTSCDIVDQIASCRFLIMPISGIDAFPFTDKSFFQLKPAVRLRGF